jgi:uncharacterized protein YecE (DUF72 family)
MKNNTSQEDLFAGHARDPGLRMPILDKWKPPEIPPDLSRHGFYVGTSGYYFDDWLGLFNPPRVPARQQKYLTDDQKADQDRLRFYQKYFGFVEINSSFYTEPVLESYLDIEKRSKETTLFTVKVNRKISHEREPETDRGVELMEQHITAVSPLIETGRFYSFLIQLEDHNQRSLKKLDYLLAVSEAAVRKKIDVHIEFRHKSWHNEHVLQKLKDYGVGICNTEIPRFSHTFPLKAYATTDKGYVRYSGRNSDNWYPKQKAATSKERTAQRNRRYDYMYSEQEIKSRVENQIKLSKKTNATAVAYNNHYRIQAVLNAITNLKMLKWRFGLG